MWCYSLLASCFQCDASHVDLVVMPGRSVIKNLSVSTQTNCFSSPKLAHWRTCFSLKSSSTNVIGRDLKCQILAFTKCLEIICHLRFATMSYSGLLNFDCLECAEFLKRARWRTETFVRKCHPARAGKMVSFALEISWGITNGSIFFHHRWLDLITVTELGNSSTRAPLQSQFRCHRLHVGTNLASDFGFPKSPLKNLYQHTSTGRKFVLVEGLSYDLVCAGSIYHVHFEWHVCQGQYWPGFTCNKLKNLSRGEIDQNHVHKRILGERVCSTKTQQAQLLSSQCITAQVLHWH